MTLAGRVNLLSKREGCVGSTRACRLGEKDGEHIYWGRRGGKILSHGKDLLVLYRTKALGGSKQVGLMKSRQGRPRRKRFRLQRFLTKGRKVTGEESFPGMGRELTGGKGKSEKEIGMGHIVKWVFREENKQNTKDKKKKSERWKLNGGQRKS